MPVPSTKTIPKVSVLIPIYNVEKYLEQCLDSVVGQTLRDLEIICINDGSTDSSPEIIRKYADSDSRIKVITKKNSGYGDSMNMGLAAATGKYIGIVESDDYIEPGMFETLYKMAETDKLDVARSEFFFHDNNKGTDKISETGYVPHDKVICPLEERSVFYQQPSIWANLYLRKFLVDNSIDFLRTPGASYQDTSFTFKVYSSAKRFEMIGDAFYHYRTFAGSSSFVGNTKVFCVCDEYEEIEKYLRSRGAFDAQKDVYFRLKFNAYHWNYFRLVDPYDKQFAARWKEQFADAMESGDLDPSIYNPSQLSNVKELLETGVILKNEPRVSVVVPVYNSEKYLRKCLDSLKCQTLKGIEIICVNDGSTDSSAEILKEYAEADKRFKIVTKKNGGLSSARNAGIEVANAKFIAFLDSDDWVVPEAYESVVSNIYGEDLVIFGTKVVGDYMEDKRDSDNRYYAVKYSGKKELTDDVLLNVDVSAWDKLYRLDLIRENRIRFPEGKLYEDYEFFWKYTSYCKTAYFDPNQYHRYLRHEGSIMDTTFHKSSRAMEHLSVLKDVFDNYYSRSVLSGHVQRNNSMFLNCFWFAYLNVPEKDKKKVLREGVKIADKFGLEGDEVIDALRRKDYARVDRHKGYSFKVRAMKKVFGSIEHSIGGNLSTFKKMLYGTYREPSDKSDSVATTDWVNRHENSQGVERWSVIYDRGSPNEFVNWGQKDGISGSLTIPDSRKNVFSKNTELKILVSLYDVETAVLQGTILNDRRSIWGTALYDGISVFAISVDLNVAAGVIKPLAIVTKSGNDVSSHCKIIRIESRIY